MPLKVREVMNYLYESLVPSIAFAAVAAAILGVVYNEKKHVAWLLAAVLAPLTIVGVGYLIATGVTTPREEVIETIHAGARACETNDLEQILPFIEDGTPPGVAVIGYLKMFTARSIKARGIEVEINELGVKPMAHVELIVLATGQYSAGADSAPVQGQPFRVTLEMHKNGDKWQVYSFTKPEPLRP